jgi:hypothetical protein
MPMQRQKDPAEQVDRRETLRCCQGCPRSRVLAGGRPLRKRIGNVPIKIAGGYAKAFELGCR